MNKTNWERWGVATGYLVFALGIAAAAFERGAPPANAPAVESGKGEVSFLLVGKNTPSDTLFGE